jgi:hypothetical protein
MTTATAKDVNVFEYATRYKLRFETSAGNLTVEQLWELPLTSGRPGKANLDEIAIELNEALEKSKGKSFVKNVKKDETLQKKFDVVKHIIDTKVAENEAKLAENNKQAQREKLDRLIENAEDAELAGKTPDELRKMRAEL